MASLEMTVIRPDGSIQMKAHKTNNFIDHGGKVELTGKHLIKVLSIIEKTDREIEYRINGYLVERI